MSDEYPPDVVYTTWHGGGDMMPTILTPEEAAQYDDAVMYVRSTLSASLWHRRAMAAKREADALRVRVAELEAELEGAYEESWDKGHADAGTTPAPF